jgi:hypothetical protein
MTIAGNLFNGATALTSLALPAEFKSMGSNSFASCSSLKSLTFADRTSDITLDTQLWYGNQALTTVTLGNGMISEFLRLRFSVERVHPAHDRDHRRHVLQGLHLADVADDPCLDLGQAFNGLCSLSQLPALLLYGFAQTNSFNCDSNLPLN